MTVPDRAPVDLEALEQQVRAELDEKYAARELALKNCRPIIRGSANAIRALHRGEGDTAAELMAEVRVLIREAEAPLDGASRHLLRRVLLRRRQGVRRGGTHRRVVESPTAASAERVGGRCRSLPQGTRRSRRRAAASSARPASAGRAGRCGTHLRGHGGRPRSAHRPRLPRWHDGRPASHHRCSPCV